jgi:hypothetical protein
MVQEDIKPALKDILDLHRRRGGLHNLETWFHYGIQTNTLIHVFYYVVMQKFIFGYLLFVETL